MRPERHSLRAGARLGMPLCRGEGDDSTPTHRSVQRWSSLMSSKGSETFGGGNPWNYIQPWDDELFGADVRDPAKRTMWEQAVAVAGGLPYIWTELARPISEIVYG